ncbi:MAG: hypothetical protein JXB25_05810 [Deltaproteobacteria bacterium]|nr:hypothetical protein [Deltaproteobacteria bacterium]
MVEIKSVDQVFRPMVPRGALESPEAFFKTLVPGKIVEMTVARGGEGRVVLEHGGVRFAADTQMPLQEGARLSLLVTSNSPRIELKIADRPAGFQSGIWPLLSESALLPRLLTRLLEGGEGMAFRLAPELRNLLRGFAAVPSETAPVAKEAMAGWLKSLGLPLPEAGGAGSAEGPAAEPKMLLQALLGAALKADPELRQSLESFLGGLRVSSPGPGGGKGEALLRTLLTAAGTEAPVAAGGELSRWLENLGGFLAAGKTAASPGSIAAEPKAFLQALLKADPELRNGLETLLAGFRQRALPAGSESAAAFLRAALDVSGREFPAGERELVVQWLKSLGIPLAGENAAEQPAAELRLALKAVLAEVPETMPELRKGLENVLEGMLGQRLPGAGKGEEAYLFYLPLPFLEKGFLVWEREAQDQEAGKPAAHRMTLFLETEALGALRVDFLYEGEGVMVRFSSPSREVRDFLASCRQELIDGWPEFPLLGLRFEIGSETPGNELARRLTGSPGGAMVTTWV